MTAAAATNTDARTSSAVRELGERISKLETGQALVLGRLDGLAVQLSGACADMRSEGSRLDDHETRLKIREVAYQERILPALEKLDKLEVKVASSAVLGGSITTIIAGIVFAVGKAAGWF